MLKVDLGRLDREGTVLVEAQVPADDALWQDSGSPEGRDQEYWYRAERELSEEAGLDTSEEAAEVTQPTPPAGTLAR